MMVRTRAKWTDAEDDIIRKHYPTTTNDAMVALLPGRTKTAITLRAAGFRISKTAEHRSEMSRASFLRTCERRGVKPGQQPRPIGSTHRKGRYTLIKVAQPDVWKPLHVHIWERANGPVPEGMIVTARDGNIGNVDLANLCLRTTAENQLRHNHNYKGLPEEVVDILHLQNEIKKTIKRKRQQ
ncbi:HNH endonuclease signature motif containing protein [Pseudomonas sp. UBA6323]|uniref:HNH endonuclease signature motif containing protein n=1 Tax=Pseudomonas sp. UBA6323 TaxID=1947329 RepID=UPI0025DB25D9|nr:HNH endonuclease signature motif containing protein [Pseudomonas sp. UBA6323]